MTFDHSPILLTVEQRFCLSIPTYRTSRYEAHWSTYEDCIKVVQDVWQSVGLFSGSLTTISVKLGSCMKSLKRWVCNEAPITDQTLQEKLTKLEVIQTNLTASLVEEAKQLQREISCLQERLHLKWKQRVKMHWLQHGTKHKVLPSVC